MVGAEGAPSRAKAAKVDPAAGVPPVRAGGGCRLINARVETQLSPIIRQ